MFTSVVFFTLFFLFASNWIGRQTTLLEVRNLPDTVLVQLKTGVWKADTVAYVYAARELSDLFRKEGVQADSLFRVQPLVDRWGIARVELPRLVLDSCLFETRIRAADRRELLHTRRELEKEIALGQAEAADTQLYRTLCAFRPDETPVYDWRTDRDESKILRRQQFVNRVTAQISKWTPLFMMLLLPVLALLMKWAYRRKRMRYMEHFVHAIHLNTVFLLLVAAPLSILIFAFGSSHYSRLLTWSTALLAALILGYMYLSFRRVYGEGRFRTARKTLAVFGIFSLLTLGVAATLFVLLLVYYAENLL